MSSEPKKSTSIQPSFRAQFLEKVWNMDFSELQRPAVLIEVSLISIPLIVGAFGSRRLMQRNRKNWLQKQFHSTLNISINTLQKQPNGHYRLSFRTLSEVQMDAVIPNPEGIKQIELACKKATMEDVLLPLPAPHHWICYNQVLNHVAAMSRDGFLMRDVAGPESTISDWYVIGLTYEPNTIQKKIRALVIKKNDLLEMADSVEDYDMVEIVYHHDRIAVLKQMAIRYKKQCESAQKREADCPRPDTTQSNKLPVVELCVPRGNYKEQVLDL